MYGDKRLPTFLHGIPFFPNSLHIMQEYVLAYSLVSIFRLLRVLAGNWFDFALRAVYSMQSSVKKAAQEVKVGGNEE